MKERVKATVRFEGGGPGVSLTNITNKQQSILRRGSVMLAACLQAYHEGIYDNLACNG